MDVDISCKHFTLSALYNASVDALVFSPHILDEKVAGFRDSMTTADTNNASF